jgi:hypothetical protein
LSFEAPLTLPPMDLVAHVGMGGALFDSTGTYAVRPHNRRPALALVQEPQARARLHCTGLTVGGLLHLTDGVALRGGGGSAGAGPPASAAVLEALLPPGAGWATFAARGSPTGAPPRFPLAAAWPLATALNAKAWTAAPPAVGAAEAAAIEGAAAAAAAAATALQGAGAAPGAE